MSAPSRPYSPPAGSDTGPVKFEEFWTLTRPVGPGVWKLSAIRQP
jgi:predicted lipid-binding transport protein (Tim44 family)